MQSTYQIGSLILAAVTIWVLIKARGAADAQAEAARALTDVAGEQKNAAILANELTSAQMLALSRPVLVLLPDRSKNAVGNYSPYLIQNQGPGIAQKVRWNYMTPTNDQGTVLSSLIGSNYSTEVSIDENMLNGFGVLISYESLNGDMLTTKVVRSNGSLTQNHEVDRRGRRVQ